MKLIVWDFQYVLAAAWPVFAKVHHIQLDDFGDEDVDQTIVMALGLLSAS